MAKTEYQVRFRQGDVEFEVRGDKTFVNRAYSEFKSGLLGTTRSESMVSSRPTASPAAPRSNAKNTSPRELLDRFGVKRHVDVVLAFGYYLEKYRALKGFTSVDINTCYYEAKIEPSNTSQMIINNIRKGYMMQAPRSGKKKTFTITRTGEEFVEAGFKKPKAQ